MENCKKMRSLLLVSAVSGVRRKGFARTTFGLITRLAMTCGLLVFPAIAQTVTTGSSFADLQREAEKTSNVKLRQILSDWSPIAITSSNGAASLYVLGDIETRFQWNDQSDHRVKLRNGDYVILHTEGMQELLRRRQSLINVGLPDTGPPSDADVEADARRDELTEHENVPDSLLTPLGAGEASTQPPPPSQTASQNQPSPPVAHRLNFAVNSLRQIQGAIIIVGTAILSLILRAKKGPTVFAFIALGAPAWLWLFEQLTSGQVLLVDASVLDWCGGYILPFAVGFSIWFTLDLYRVRLKSSPRATADGAFSGVDVGCPHARYIPTKQGCVLLVHNEAPFFLWSLFGLFVGSIGFFWYILHDLDAHLHRADAGGRIGAAITLALLTQNTPESAAIMTMLPAVAIIGAFLFYLFVLRPPTRIEFSPGSVRIDNTNLKRSEIKAFMPGEKVPTEKGSSASTRQLCYVYGGRTYSFGGHYFGEAKALDVASGLNRLLQQTATADSVAQHNQPTPAQLRNARPSDF